MYSVFFLLQFYPAIYITVFGSIWRKIYGFLKTELSRRGFRFIYEMVRNRMFPDSLFSLDSVGPRKSYRSTHKLSLQMHLESTA